MDSGAGDLELEDLDENADARTVVTAHMRTTPSLCTAPALATGAMQAPATVPEKKRPRASKKAPSVGEQILEAEQEDDLGQGSEISGADDLPDWVAKDDALKKVCLKLGKVYKCLAALQPEEILVQRKPIGHQVTGVGCWQKRDPGVLKNVSQVQLFLFKIIRLSEALMTQDWGT